MGIVRHRMPPDGFGAVVGGLVGPATQSIVESSQHERIAEATPATFPDSSRRLPARNAATDRLRADGTFAIVEIRATYFQW